MTSLYTVLKFVHVAAIAVWVGGVIVMVLLNRIFSSGDPAIAQAFGRQGAVVSQRVFMPAMLVTLITGIGLVQVGKLSFGLSWIIWGIVGLVASVVLGGVLTGATARKLAQQIARGEIDQAGAAAVRKRIMLFATLNIIVLLSIVYAMVAKPE